MRVLTVAAVCIASTIFTAHAEDAASGDIALCATIQSGRWAERELGSFESCLQLTRSQVSAERVRFGRWGEVLIAYDGSGFLVSRDEGKRWELLKSLDLQSKDDAQLAAPSAQSNEETAPPTDAPPPTPADGLSPESAKDADAEPAPSAALSEAVAEQPDADAGDVYEASGNEQQPLEHTTDNAVPDPAPSGAAIPLAEAVTADALMKPPATPEETGVEWESPPPDQDHDAPLDEGRTSQPEAQAGSTVNTVSTDTIALAANSSTLKPERAAVDQSAQGERPQSPTLETPNNCRIKSSDRWIQSNAPSLLVCAKLLDQSPEIYDQQGLKYAYWRDQLLVATKYEIYVVDHESQRTSLLKRHRY